MASQSKPRKRIADVRIPIVSGKSDEIYHLLHHSFVEIVHMRRSIECADFAIALSEKAIVESTELLKRCA